MGDGGESALRRRRRIKGPAEGAGNGEPGNEDTKQEGQPEGLVPEEEQRSSRMRQESTSQDITVNTATATNTDNTPSENTDHRFDHSTTETTDLAQDATIHNSTIHTLSDNNVSIADGMVRTGSGDFEDEKAEEAEEDQNDEEVVVDSALEIFVHRSEEGAWVITPLSGHCELQLGTPIAEGVPPAGCHGVIWRLDNKVLPPLVPAGSAAKTGANGSLAEDDEEPEDELDEDEARRDDQSLARTISRRLKKIGVGMKRLKGVSDKLQVKLSRYQEDQLALEGDRHRLQQGRSDISRQEAELKEGLSHLEQERRRFNVEVRQAAEHLSHSLRLPVRAGDFAVFPPDAFVVAAQDEFAGAAPPLDQADQEELQHVRLAPEAAFASAREAFFSSDGSDSVAAVMAMDPTARTGSGAEATVAAAVPPRVDALVRALLALQCLLDSKQASGRLPAPALEQLSGLAQGLSRLANFACRMPLSFAASSCVLWCGLNLVDHLSQKFDEAKPLEMLKELEAQAPLGLGSVSKRAKQLVQQGSSTRRLLRGWAEYPEHRRRFVRCLANRDPDNVSDADLRLLFLPRNASPAELAAHIRRLSNVVDDNVVLSRRSKRPWVGE
ncbi:unnamed protein product, partial [Polarella glacialis]